MRAYYKNKRPYALISKRIEIFYEEGASADAGSHYQKLYGRVTDVCGNRRGQPKLSAMQEPHSGGNSFVIKLSSPSGKYALVPFTFPRIAVISYGLVVTFY